jgi:hypothetical protein
MFDGPLVTVTVCLRWLPSWLPELAGHISHGGFQSNFSVPASRLSLTLFSVYVRFNHKVLDCSRRHMSLGFSETEAEAEPQR